MKELYIRSEETWNIKRGMSGRGRRKKQREPDQRRWNDMQQGGTNRKNEKICKMMLR